MDGTPNQRPAHDAEAVLRRLPQLQRLLEASPAQGLCDRYGRDRVVTTLRALLDGLRAEIRSGHRRAVPGADALVTETGRLLAVAERPLLRGAINATGIVLHTNLGRARLSAEAVAAVVAVASGYCNLEIDLKTGRRGARMAPVETLLCALTGAGAALAVNNGAAAILLALSAHASGGDVVVSRGELVEIGGGFRIPDVIRQGGARLVEVGTTNRTRIDDYRDAIGPDTRAVLKVHQSNFRISGFVEESGCDQLAALAREHGIPLIVDLGSGLLRPVAGTAEPTVSDVLSGGADLVTFSGDKLLGGPQAGLIAGTETAVAPLRRHPLMRALRLDKLGLAATEATLRLHRDAPDRVPTLRMLATDATCLHTRAERLRVLVGQGQVVTTQALAGGGALPGHALESRGLSLHPSIGAEDAAARLRLHDPAVFCRIDNGALLADVLTVDDAELPDLAEALVAVLG